VRVPTNPNAGELMLVGSFDSGPLAGLIEVRQKLTIAGAGK
jgi:hypothetical protein